MTKTPKAVDSTATTPPPTTETDEQRFERILHRLEFKPLKAVFDHLGATVSTLRAAIIGTYCYDKFLSKLGYGVVIVNQIHESDCYSRVGRKGGIRAVLPVHDIATYSTLITLVNYDSTLTTTANAMDYFDNQLREFKIQLMNRSGNA
jgi:hypothetical protein